MCDRGAGPAIGLQGSTRWRMDRSHVISAMPAKVDGVKISLLDKDQEIVGAHAGGRFPQWGAQYSRPGDDFNVRPY